MTIRAFLLVATLAVTALAQSADGAAAAGRGMTTSLSITDVTQVETNAGTTTFSFTVQVAYPSGTVTFDIATLDGTAVAGSDYVAKSLTGQTVVGSTYTFTVTVNGDDGFEPNETFFVNVTNVSGAVVTDTQGLGTISNDDAVPLVSGVLRDDPSPTGAASVDFAVSFTKPVTGVDASDFTLSSTGLTGPAITGVTGSGQNWTVTASTGTGSGTLGLDVLDNDTVVDSASAPLGGAGAANGSFAAGEDYTLSRTAPAVTTTPPAAPLPQPVAAALVAPPVRALICRRVPTFTRHTLGYVRRVLDRDGCASVPIVVDNPKPTIPASRLIVTRQAPAAGTPLFAGDRVRVVVRRKPRQRRRG